MSDRITVDQALKAVCFGFYEMAKEESDRINRCIFHLSPDDHEKNIATLTEAFLRVIRVKDLREFAEMIDVDWVLKQIEKQKKHEG